MCSRKYTTSTMGKNAKRKIVLENNISPSPNISFLCHPIPLQRMKIYFIFGEKKGTCTIFFWKIRGIVSFVKVYLAKENRKISQYTRMTFITASTSSALLTQPPAYKYICLLAMPIWKCAVPIIAKYTFKIYTSTIFYKNSHYYVLNLIAGSDSAL